MLMYRQHMLFVIQQHLLNISAHVAASWSANLREHQGLPDSSKKGQAMPQAQAEDSHHRSVKISQDPKSGSQPS
jgi:hypothetical protein